MLLEDLNWTCPRVFCPTACSLAGRRCGVWRPAGTSALNWPISARPHAVGLDPVGPGDDGAEERSSDQDVEQRAGARSRRAGCGEQERSGGAGADLADRRREARFPPVPRISVGNTSSPRQQVGLRILGPMPLVMKLNSMNSVEADHRGLGATGEVCGHRGQLNSFRQRSR